MPLPLLAGVGSVLSGIHIGGISGESYNNVMDESIANAAAAGDWARISAIAAGGETAGLPYNNSDGKGGWSTNQTMHWGGAEFAPQRQLAQSLLQQRSAGVSSPSAVTYGAGPQTLSSIASDVSRAALNAGQLDVAAAAQSSATQVSRAATAATAQAQGRTASGLLKSLTPTQLLIGVVLLGALAYLILRRR